MATEIELKLQLTPLAARQLPSHPLLADIKPQKLHLLNTYYDTPTLQLHERRIALRFRKKGWQWLLTVKSAEPASGGLALRSEWETPAAPGQFNFNHVDNPELRDFLDSAVSQLEPIFTTDFRRTIWHIPFGESLIEMAVDRGNAQSNGRKSPICEIELELLKGRIDDIFGLTRTLQDTLDLHPAIASKAERGYAIFTNSPATPFRAKTAPLNPNQTPLEAFRTIALGCLEHFQRNEHGLTSSKDPEYVHQARVALRRLRSAIKLFAPLLPADFVSAYGQTWQTLASALGEARNWDVFITETLPPIQAAFPKHHDTQRLYREGTRRARQARKAVIHMLALPEYPRLIVEFTAAIYALSDPLPQNLEEFARQQLKSRARSARRLAKLHNELKPAERHRMRISFKKLRYAVEFFAPLLPAKALRHHLPILTRLQNELGLINDHISAQMLICDTGHTRHLGPADGWIAGRHELLVGNLQETLEYWLEQDSLWK